MKFKKESSKKGISAAILIGVLLVTLKITGIITWSWWLVTLPLWVIPAVWFAVFVAIMVAAFLEKIGGGK